MNRARVRNVLELLRQGVLSGGSEMIWVVLAGIALVAYIGMLLWYATHPADKPRKDATDRKR